MRPFGAARPQLDTPITRISQPSAMSETDRHKWDARYRAGAFTDRAHPSALLAAWIDRLPVGRALDLACGAGRNALFLARNGFDVTGVDISTVGLERAQASARTTGLNVDWQHRDLDEPFITSERFQAICLFRYVNRPLIRKLPELLAPDGLLIVEEHLAIDSSKVDVPIIGPTNPEFLVRPGELASLLSGLNALHHAEGIVTDPDGRHAALARFVGTLDDGELVHNKGGV